MGAFGRETLATKMNGMRKLEPFGGEYNVEMAVFYDIV